MKKFQKLERYPLGAIHAEGFLRDQLIRAKDGIGGHLHELEPKMIGAPFTQKVYVEAWGNGDQSGWGAEISGNYWTGYIEEAFTLNDAEMIKTATDWVNAMMKNQRQDGYLGTYYEPDAKIYEDYNAWGTACAMRGLLAFYEATGREDVLKAVHRCMLWFCEVWSGDNKTCYAGQLMIEPMIFTYQHTGDERLAQFAEEYLDYLCKNDIFRVSYPVMQSDEYHYNSNHTAGMGIQLRLPALVYTATGKKEYLQASVHGIEKVRAKSVQLTGSPVSMSEYLGPVASTTESEYCNYAFYNATYSYMSYITGDTKYGDFMEEMFYNGAQGARKKDERAIAYLNSPNQFYATTESSAAYGDMQVYAPCYPTSCCPVNAVVVVPEFIRGMLLHDDKENVWVAAYGPCSLNWHGVSLREETHYPFRNKVTFVVDCEKNFALYLKIPGWSRKEVITVNGKEVKCEYSDNYAILRRDWKPGDRVEICFKAEVEVKVVNDSDYASKYPLAIQYGALLFSYHLPEQWVPVKGAPMTPLAEGWSWYAVYPDYKEADVADPHEQIGLRRDQISWNIALDEKISPEEIRVEEVPENGYVWENPMIKLHTYCYKAPYMCAPYPTKTFEPYEEYQYVTDRLPLELVPYGCTNLRMTYFPKAKLSE